jgi:hypothetical protein
METNSIEKAKLVTDRYVPGNNGCKRSSAGEPLANAKTLPTANVINIAKAIAAARFGFIIGLLVVILRLAVYNSSAGSL